MHKDINKRMHVNNTECTYDQVMTFPFVSLTHYLRPVLLHADYF